MKRFFTALLFPALISAGLAADAEVKGLSIDGGVAADGKARLTIEGTFGSPQAAAQKVLFSTSVRHLITISREKITHQLALSLEVLQGDPKEFALTIGGEGEIKPPTHHTV